ncbi:MAG TPA: MFS transporter [Solirubrobacterales bacterium]|nr:MFS transporter [Solirubrobacterales bacterium]
MSRGRLAAAATLIFVALNLRMAIAAVPPVLTQIQRDTGLSSAGSGLLTAVPLFCFGAVAPSAPALVQRLRMGPVLGLTLAVVAIGCAIRLAPSLAALFIGTAVIGAGIAVANVLLPSLIKRDFADQAALMIALYAVSLFVGAAIPAGLTVPIEHATGIGWRPAVALWGVVALIALALWLPRSRSKEPPAPPRAASSPARDLRRDRLAWAVTFFMGLQSLGYYATLSWLPTILESHGMSDSKAGWMLSYTMFPGMAASLLTPTLQRRIGREEICVGLAVAFCGLGYLGLLAAADSATYVWVTALGVGQGIAITLALSYIIARARDHHIAHLSTMAQSVGYLIASTGPFILGALHGLTSSWTVPLLVLLGTLVPLGAAGLIAGRGGHVLADAER